MKYVIKFEQGIFEQTYKLSEMELTDGVNSVFKILDEDFIAIVVARFKPMAEDFRAAYRRYE